jgi:hypothetical protein
VKEKGREDKNPERKDFLRPEGRLVMVLLLMENNIDDKVTLSKSLTPPGYHRSKTRSTNLLPQSTLLVLQAYTQFALALCTEVI